MSILDIDVPQTNPGEPPAVPAQPAKRSLHRLAQVRRRQGISRRTVARRLNADVDEVKQQERSETDMTLSRLYQWQKALEVPIAELLVETEEPLSAPVLRRAQMIRLMKTALAILERCQQVSIRRMAQVLADQLVEIMPELAQVTPWHAVGRRRSRSEVGKAAQRRIGPDALRSRDFLGE
jgi:transcriptional regulator with XRE-family HTH domain